MRDCSKSHAECVHCNIQQRTNNGNSSSCDTYSSWQYDSDRSIGIKLLWHYITHGATICLQYSIHFDCMMLNVRTTCPVQRAVRTNSKWPRQLKQIACRSCTIAGIRNTMTTCNVWIWILYLRFAQLRGSGNANRLCANAIVAPIVNNAKVRITDILQCNMDNRK